MMNFGFLKQIEGTIRQYKSFPFPAIVCDRQFKVYWCNRCAKELQPGLCDTPGLRAALSEFELGELISRLKEGDEVSLTDVFPFHDLLINLQPLWEDEEVIGVIVLLLAASATPRLDGFYRASRSAQALSASVRQSVGNIFSAMDSVSLTADLVEAGWVKQGLNGIGLDSYRILRVVNNLSAYAAFQNDGYAKRFTAIDLTQTLTELGETIAEIGRSMEIPIRFILPQEPCFITGDAELIGLAFYNALHNSLYYTKAGNHITVSLRKSEDGKSALFQISDCGLGIPGDFLPDVFRPYTAYSHNGKGSGVGLGLTLVHAVADSHGAAVDLSSKEGEGTEVTITFPLTSPNAPLSFQQSERMQLSDRFSPLYIGLSDAEISPYRDFS